MLSAEKFDILLALLATACNHIIFPEFKGSGIQAINKANKLLSVMTVCRCGFYNGLMANMLQIGKSTMHRIFAPYVFLMQAILSRTNLKPDMGFLPCSIP